MMQWLTAGFLLLAVFPTTTNYTLNSYGFGSGGTANSGTSNYALEGISGELSGQNAATSTYTIKPGFNQTQQANLPKIAAFNNNNGVYYNKLHFEIDQQGNPYDALYALSISTDNFTSDVRYVKNDLSVGNTLSLSDYQNYASWGGSSGANILGLNANTTYYLRVKATQGKYTESGYGPAANATTANPQLSFSVSTNSLAFSSLLPGSVVDANQTLDLTFATNASSGGDVYLNGQYGGLHSASKNWTISSSTGDLSSLSNGYGARVASTSTTSGSINSVSPYDGSSNNVGIISSVIRKIISGSGPVVGGNASIQLKAKAASTDKSAPDYTDNLTVIASSSF